LQRSEARIEVFFTLHFLAPLVQAHGLSRRSFLEVGAAAGGGLMLSPELAVRKWQSRSGRPRCLCAQRIRRHRRQRADRDRSNCPCQRSTRPLTVIVSTGFRSRPINTKSLRAIFLASYGQRRCAACAHITVHEHCLGSGHMAGHRRAAGFKVLIAS
jgi:hypothetical protein